MTLRRARPYWSGKKSESPILEGLVEYWKFDDNTTGEFGTTENVSANVSLGAGKINDGAIGVSGAFLNFPDDDRFSFTDGVNDLPFSISMWVWIDSFSVANNALFVKRPTTGSTSEYYTFIGDDTGQARILLHSEGETGVFISRISDSVLSTDTWYHLVFTYDGSGLSSGIKIYINGSEDTTSDASSGTYVRMINSTELPQFFRLGTNNNTVHKGIIDEVGIWKNKELTLTEVSELYNSGSGLQYPF